VTPTPGTTAGEDAADGIVDAHVHVWERAVVAHPWLTPDAGVLDADFSGDDLARVLADTPVRAAVLVQSADSLAEHEYLLRAAEATPLVAAVVGWLPLRDVEACRSAVDVGLHPAVAGVRHLVHVEEDPDWLVLPEVLASLQLLAGAGLTLDVPAEFPLHLHHVATVADRVPALTIVVDHLAKPPMSGDAHLRWAEALRDVARRPNVVAKLSGLTAAAREPRPPAEVLRPVTDVALDAFGPDRLLWGSDWPVLTTDSDYRSVLEWTEELPADLSAPARRGILAGNAERVYGLPRPVAATSQAHGREEGR